MDSEPDSGTRLQCPICFILVRSGRWPPLGSRAFWPLENNPLRVSNGSKGQRGGLAFVARRALLAFKFVARRALPLEKIYHWHSESTVTLSLSLVYQNDSPRRACPGSCGPRRTRPTSERIFLTQAQLRPAESDYSEQARAPGPGSPMAPSAPSIRFPLWPNLGRPAPRACQWLITDSHTAVGIPT